MAGLASMRESTIIGEPVCFFEMISRFQQGFGSRRARFA
jgi:hypothetical protein